MTTKRAIRAVIDTNIFVSAHRSPNPAGLAYEIIDRWESGEYTLLASEFLHDEIARKLIELRFDEERIIERLALLRATAEWIDVPEEAVEPATNDPDDDYIVACAVTGGADYLVTYNRKHYAVLGEVYRGVQIITQPWVFLNILRDAAASKVDNP